MKGRLFSTIYCLILLLAGVLYISVGAIHELPLQAVAAIKYRLGTGDEIDFTAVTKTNQGPGSGLDADKIDGLNSTVFLQSSSSASNTFDLGDGQNNTNKIYKFNIGGANLPGVRYNAQTGKVQFSHDGTTWSDMGTGGGSAPNIENNDTLVATSPATLDFSSKFSVTESPAGEANINIASGGVTSTEIADGTIANADVSASAAIAESKLSLNFATHSNTNDPTAGEKSALAGTNGIPSGTNKYVTDSDARNTNARTPTAHGASLHDSTVEATANKNAANGYPGLDTSGKISGAQVTYGIGANTACEGNDARLSNARTPTAHASTHATGGADAFTSTDVLEAISKRLQESGGPTTLAMGAVADGQFLKRSGTSVVGAAAGGITPQVLAYVNTAQSVSPSTWTKVQFNAEAFDDNNEFDSTTNYRFTPADSKRRSIKVCIEFQAWGGSTIGVSIYKGGTAWMTRYFNGMNSGSVPNIFQLVTALNLTATTDYIEVFVWHDSASAKNVQASQGESFIVIEE